MQNIFKRIAQADLSCLWAHMSKGTLELLCLVKTFEYEFSLCVRWTQSFIRWKILIRYVVIAERSVWGSAQDPLTDLTAISTYTYYSLAICRLNHQVKTSSHMNYTREKFNYESNTITEQSHPEPP